MPEFDLMDTLAGFSKTDRGEMIPDGDYPMRCIEATFGFSAQKGTPGFTYKAAIIDGGDYDGDTLEGTAWVSTTKRGKQLFYQQISALGITTERIAAERLSNEQAAEAMVGVEFIGTISTEKPKPGENFRPRNRLIASEALGGGGQSVDEYDSEPDSGDDLPMFPENGQVPETEAAATPAVDEPKDDPADPGPDGTAGDTPVDLEAEAVSVGASGNSLADDDPWG